MEWLEKLFSECESNEELMETIKEYIEENYNADSEDFIEREEYEKMKDQYEEEIKRLKEEIEKEHINNMLENQIKAEGGKNAKAIMAVMEEENFLKDEEGKITGIDLTSVKEKAPYLFYEMAEKVEGTGVRKEVKKAERNRFMESARRAAGIAK